MIFSRLTRLGALVGPAAIVAFVAAALVSTVGAWQIMRTRDALLAGAEGDARTLARVLAQHAARTIEGVDLVLSTVVEQVQSHTSTAALTGTLRRREAMLGQARNLAVTDASGLWIADTAPPHGLLSSADRRYFAWHRDHRDADLHIGSPTIGLVTGKSGIPLTRRIEDGDGSFAGVAIAMLAPEHFESFYGTAKIGQKGTVTLWASDGQLLVRYPSLPGGVTRTSPTIQQVAKVFGARSGVNRSLSPFDGVERIFAFEGVGNYPLFVAAAISVDEALEVWTRQALPEGIVIGLAAIILIVLGLGFEAHRRRVRILQRESQKLNRHYRLLAENSSDLIALKPTFGGPRAFVSPSSRSTVGWDPEELSKLSTKTYIHPDDLARVDAEFASLTSDNPQITSLHRALHKAGHYVWLESTFRLIADGSVVVASRDVTTRHEAQQALADSEVRYRLLATASSDMVQQLDLNGHRIYVSPAASEIFGYEVSELIGTHPAEFIHPDESERVRGWISELTSGQRDQARSIHRIRHKAGHFVWVEVQFRLVRHEETGAPVEIVSNVRDVTQREAMRHRVEEANRSLLAAEEIAHVGHWRVDLAEGTLTWSDEVYRIHGFDPATYAPSVRNAIETYHPDDREEVARCVAAAIEHQVSYEFKRRIVRPDGEVRHVLSRGTCETGRSGKVTAIFGTIMDVTELRQAERAAVESEARYRLLADNSTDMITHMDLTGRRLFVSPGSRELLGYDPQELVGTSPQQMLHPDDASGLEHAFSDMAAGKLDRAVNVNRLRHKDGRWIWVEASLKLLRDDDGRPSGFVGAIRNIMDRRRADEALRESEARYRVLAEATSDVITQLGLDLKRQYVSPACRRVFGYEPEEMLGSRPSAAIHPDDVSDVRDLGSKLVAGEIDGDRAVTTYRTLHKKGHWFWIEAVLSLVRHAESGLPSSIICSLRDVTERQRIARHLERAKAAAEQAALAKAEFVANMSHELRTPLTAILGVNDLLQRDSKLSDAQRHLVSLSGEASRSLLTIVNDVLDFSKIEAGQLSIEIMPFSVRDLIEGCRELASQGLQEKQVEIRISFAADPGSLVGDPTRLRQILLNLLTNAVKFTSAGQVDIAVDYGSETGLLRIEVSDTGIGIPEAKLPALFERFSQADASITRRYGGSGLGLAICKRLLDLMSGRIGVRSVEGQGSAFWFELPLPLATLEAHSIATEEAAVELRSRWSILLAEDNRINQEIIGTVLREQQHTVIVVPDGAAALATVRSDTRVDVILMDLQMPVMDGLTASAAIRQAEADLGKPAVPIIGLTANALAEDIERCLAAGMNAHIAKPIEWHALFKTMERLMGPSRPERAAAAMETTVDVLDAAKLEELAEIIGRVRLTNILAKFVDDLSRRLEAIDRATSEELSAHMHSLVAQAGQLGFQQLSQLCSDIDGNLRAGNGRHRTSDIRAAAERAVAAARSFEFSKVA